MKLIQEKQENHSRGIVSIHEYEVLNNSKIMNMLSSQLYSDKIKAPIRELVSNAYDSLVSANNLNSKIVITLPSNENPEFRIRDYGTGLSEDQLINLYRFYGLSDKDQSNTMIGMMGIGSKSPWAYTNVFTTTSYYNGSKYIYVNNKMGRNGVPELCKLHEESTDEPNGVEISFAVNKYDINKFAEEAVHILQYFPIEFQIIDDNGYYKKYKEKYQSTILFEGKDWQIKDRSGCYAIMGYIEYPINTSKLSNSSWLSGLNLYINFDIGDLGVNLGREELEYTPKTIKQIEDKMERIYDEVRVQINKKLEQCACYYDACKLYANSTYYLQRLFDSTTYNGKQIDYIIYLGSPVSKYYKRYGKIKSSFSNSISIKTDNRFFINDLNSGVKNIVEDILSKSPEIQIYVRKITNKQNKDEELKKFAEELGISEDRITLLSSIVKNSGGNTKRTITKSTNILILEYISKGGYSESEYWKSVNIDLKNGGIYIETTGNKLLIDGVKSGPSNIKYIFEHIKNVGITPPILYGLRPSHVKKVKKMKVWKSFQEWVDEQIKIVAPTVSKEDIDKYYYYNNLEYGVPFILEKIAKEKDLECEDIVDLFRVDRTKVTNYIKFMNSLYNLGSYYNKYQVKAHNKTLDKYRLLYPMVRSLEKIDTETMRKIVKLFNLLNELG